MDNAARSLRFKGAGDCMNKPVRTAPGGLSQIAENDLTCTGTLDFPGDKARKRSPLAGVDERIPIRARHFVYWSSGASSESPSDGDRR